MKQAPILSERDVRRLLAHISRNSFPARNRLIFMLGWLAGMRIGEIAALKLGNVVKNDGEVRNEIHLRAEQTKGSRGRMVLLNSQLQQEIKTYLSTSEAPTSAEQSLVRSRSGKAFSANGLCILMLKLYDRAGLDKATTHSPRRSFITTLAHKGVNVRVLAALAGHQSIATTQRYIDLNENVLRAAVEMV